MTTLTAVVDRVRLELADLPEKFSESFVGDGATTVFVLNNYPLDASLLTVTVGGVVQIGAAVVVDERTGRMQFQTAPALNAVIAVSGTHYRYFSTTDLTTIVSAAFSEHVYNRTDAFGRALVIENLPAIEEYPVALLGTIQALYALATDSAFDIDISAPDGVHIPRSERYGQLMTLIAARREQYQSLCEALNIGLHRIDVFTLRRISRMTNKYVPIWQPQEIDDYSQPKRVYLPTPTYGSTPIPPAAAIYDMVMTQGDSYSITLNFGIDLTNYTLASQIRQFASSPIIINTFTITPVNLVAGTVTLSLTPTQTSILPLMSVWDLQLTNNLVANDIRTLVNGQVFCQRQVTQ